MLVRFFFFLHVFQGHRLVRGLRAADLNVHKDYTTLLLIMGVSQYRGREIWPTDWGLLQGCNFHCINGLGSHNYDRCVQYIDRSKMEIFVDIYTIKFSKIWKLYLYKRMNTEHALLWFCFLMFLYSSWRCCRLNHYRQGKAIIEPLYFAHATY